MKTIEVTDRMASDNSLFPALYILTDYQELIEGLTQDGEWFLGMEIFE